MLDKRLKIGIKSDLLIFQAPFSAKMQATLIVVAKCNNLCTRLFHATDKRSSAPCAVAEKSHTEDSDSDM